MLKRYTCNIRLVFGAKHNNIKRYEEIFCLVSGIKHELKITDSNSWSPILLIFLM